MSLGYNRELNVVNLDDTAEIVAYLYDKSDALISEEDLIGVSFVIQRPDGEMDNAEGDVTGNGEGTLLYNNCDLTGHYTAIATFETIDNGRKSSRADFEVVNPFDAEIPSASYIAAVLTWEKLEDCFDGEDEGPWLREMTLNYFNKDKMERFLNDALFDINVQNPPTDLDLSSFVRTPDATAEDQTPYPTPDAPLLAQGMLIAVIRHLMRSYTEQPNPVGAQIAWHDRRDYLQRWQQVYQIEQQQYMRMLALFKRKFLNLGESKVLIHNKAGRMIAAPMRTRYVGRGAIW
jgi:hypothetical protein